MQNPENAMTLTYRYTLIANEVAEFLQVYGSTDIPDQIQRITLESQPLSMKPYLLSIGQREILIRPAAIEQLTSGSGKTEFIYWFFATPVTNEMRRSMVYEDGSDFAHTTPITYHARPAISLYYDRLPIYRYLSRAELFRHNHHLDVIEAIKAELHAFDSSGDTTQQEFMIARPVVGASNCKVDRCARWKAALPFLIQNGSRFYLIKPTEAFVTEGFEYYWYQAQEVEKHRSQIMFSRNGHDQQTNLIGNQPVTALDELAFDGMTRRQMIADKVISRLNSSK